MGIQNRDYMKRGRPEDAGYSADPDEKVEAFLSAFLQRHRRLLLGLAIGLVVLILIAVAVAMFS